MLHYPPMSPADLGEVVAAERRIYAFPWTRGNFADALAANYGAWLAKEDGRMVGYAVMMYASDEVHLLNLSVLPELQRAGRGSALLSHLVCLARVRAGRRMLLEVRRGNSAGRSFYRRHGFVEIGRRRDYYPAHGGREDAIVLALGL